MPLHPRRAASVIVIVFALALLSAVACGSPPVGKRPSLDAGADSGVGLTLEASAEKKVVLGPDPFRITYALRNNGAPRRVRSHPLWFHVIVLSPRGRELRPLPGEAAYWEPPLNALDAEVILPADSALARSEDLRCIRPAAAAPPHEGFGKSCILGYDFAESGEYRVVVSYQGPGPTARRIVSDTVRVRYRRTW